MVVVWQIKKKLLLYNPFDDSTSISSSTCPPQFTEQHEDSGMDGAQAPTLEDPCQGVVQNDSASLVGVQQVLDSPNTEQIDHKIDHAI